MKEDGNYNQKQSCTKDKNILFISIDSFRSDILDVYQDDVYKWIDTPNIDNFAEKSIIFKKHYAGSLPCMPARREWMTGIQEMLWRPWGQIEPFDKTLPFLLRKEGYLSCMVTDHYHYFQHGSNGYVEDFNGYEFIRGHEYDTYSISNKNIDKNLLKQITASSNSSLTPERFNRDDIPNELSYMNRKNYARNVSSFDDINDYFSPKLFATVSDWLQSANEWNNWFMYVDSFDVHEPFHCPEPYASMYTNEDPRDEDLPIWPVYGNVNEKDTALTAKEIDFVEAQFAGKVTMVDKYLGEIFQTLSEENLWSNTIVVITSDHGFYLGDHDWIGKARAPHFNGLAKTPLLIWHPDAPKNGETINHLTSAVDIYATLIDFAGGKTPNNVHSKSLVPLLTGDDSHHRDWAIYGYWGTSVNITDGEYTYLHPCESDAPVDCYSTQMINPRDWFMPDTPKVNATADAYLPYTDCPVWKIEAKSNQRHSDPLLFNVDNDPNQTRDLISQKPGEHSRMKRLLKSALDNLQAPDKQYDRLNLTEDPNDC
ncbi:sulfatase-like hydrolase/transferase [Natrialbaceae archaeon A-CW3]